MCVYSSRARKKKKKFLTRACNIDPLRDERVAQLEGSHCCKLQQEGVGLGYFTGSNFKGKKQFDYEK